MKTLPFSKLPVGSLIVLGTYLPYRRPFVNDPCRPIVWTKVSATDLISVYVLDEMEFDAYEPSATNMHYANQANPDYLLSNIHQYLNADGENWFVPTHERDMAPRYANHRGFLSGFSDEELAIIRHTVPKGNIGDGIRPSCAVRLPSKAEIMPGTENTLPYFRRKGRRAYRNASDYHYTPYMFADRPDANHICVLAADGHCNAWYWPTSSCGVRPMISIRDDAMFSFDENGSIYWNPVLEKIQQEDDDMFSALFGL